MTKDDFNNCYLNTNHFIESKCSNKLMQSFADLPIHVCDVHYDEFFKNQKRVYEA